MPYAVDNERFQEAASRLLPQKIALRQELGLPVDAAIILFTAKYTAKKRPLDLLAAYRMISVPNKCLVMAGDGELRTAMSEFIREHQLERVVLTGFINQTEIVKYYATADVFVMCSGQGETWGLSVNEALNFDLPIVVTDITGCSDDLVQENQNGLISVVGDIASLANAIEGAFCLNKNRNRKIITKYSFETIALAFKEKIAL